MISEKNEIDHNKCIENIIEEKDKKDKSLDKNKNINEDDLYEKKDKFLYDDE